MVYIEPYPKSLTGRLFRDSVCLGHAANVIGKVAFEAFSGTAPRFYRFSYEVTQKRKTAIGWTKGAATTKLKRFVTSYIAIENEVVSELLPRISPTKKDDNDD